MKLHIPGLPHTVTNEAFSHCAYTGKILKFPAMMKPLGYHITHYGVAGATTVADEQVDIMARSEQDELLGSPGDDPTLLVGSNTDVTSPLYVEFNRRLRVALEQRVGPDDIVLLPFGHGHEAAVAGQPFRLMESGIGYYQLCGAAPFKVFESYAWLHWHQGRANRDGNNYEWVIPNYFDASEWTVVDTVSLDTVVYFGRLSEVKGLRTVVELARRRKDLRFVICGQGDPTPYMTEPNIEYRPPLSGRARSKLLGSAVAVVMPSEFTEPFGGVAVEAMMCGTPVLSPNFGAFTETIEDGVTGFRCHTLGDWLAGLARSPRLDRSYIADRARRLYGFERVGQQYDRAFQMIQDLQGDGWYGHRSPWWAA